MANIKQDEPRDTAPRGCTSHPREVQRASHIDCSNPLIISQQIVEILFHGLAHYHLLIGFTCVPSDSPRYSSCSVAKSLPNPTHIELGIGYDLETRGSVRRVIFLYSMSRNLNSDYFVT